MDFRAINEAGRISIEGVLSGNNSYIALDDIKFTKGACASTSTTTPQISDVTTSAQLPVSTSDCHQEAVTTIQIADAEIQMATGTLPVVL